MLVNLFLVVHGHRIRSDYTFAGAFIHWCIELPMKAFHLLLQTFFSFIHARVIYKGPWFLFWSHCICKNSSWASTFWPIRGVAKYSRSDFSFERTGAWRSFRSVIFPQIGIFLEYFFPSRMLMRAIKGTVEFNIKVLLQVVRRSSWFILDFW